MKKYNYETLKTKWASMNDLQKQEVLQNMHNAIAEAYGVPPVKVTITKDNPIFMGGYNRKDNVLLIGLHPNAPTKDVMDALVTAVHESIHRVQDYKITEKFKNNGHFGDNALLWANAQTRGYLTSDFSSFEIYARNPVEDEAYNVTNEAFMKRVGMEPIKF